MSVIRASDYRTPEANRISSFSSPSGSRPSNALEAWNGYAFDRPGSKRWESVYPGCQSLAHAMPPSTDRECAA